MIELDSVFNEAFDHFQAGRLVDAEALLQQCLGDSPGHPPSLHVYGLVCRMSGRVEQAARLIQLAIEGGNTHPLVIHDLACVLFELGRTAEAEARFLQTLAIAPDLALAHGNLGLLKQSEGDLPAAEASFARALALEPNNVNALVNLGSALSDQERPEEAEPHLRRAVGLAPDFALAHYNLGTVLLALGQTAEAVASFDRTLALEPGNANAMVNLARALVERQEATKALARRQRESQRKPPLPIARLHVGDAVPVVEVLGQQHPINRRTWEQPPNLVEANINLGVAFTEIGKLDQAGKHLNQALDLNENSAEAYNSLGVVHLNKDELESAESSFKKALELKPEMVESCNNLGIVCRNQNRDEEAIGYFRRAIALKPDHAIAHTNLGTYLLLRGDLRAGFEEYRWRLISNKQPQEFEVLTQPEWQGESLIGKSIILYCEQGAGDAIQMIRFAITLRDTGAKVTVATPQPLISLFNTIPGIEINTAWHDELFYDYKISIMCLPRLLQIDVDSIPAIVPYFNPDQERVAVWRQRLAGCRGLRVGVVWRGNPDHKNDRNRSVNPAIFARFCSLPGLSVVSLQRDGRPEELAALSADNEPFDAGPLLSDYQETAALILALDLVISVDTSVCHLVGALAVPVWTLLPFAPDWRWMLEREDSPWYPTMRLFRQQAAGDWTAVAEHVADELRTEQSRNYHEAINE